MGLGLTLFLLTGLLALLFWVATPREPRGQIPPELDKYQRGVRLLDDLRQRIRSRKL